MPKIKAEFRGLNTDLYGNATPSGTCLSTLNTVIDGNSTLSGRKGFNVWDNNTGTKGEILNMTVCEFASGVTYVVTKRTDGKLYHWQAYPTAASSWTEIQNKFTSNLHSTTNRGFFYFWADRLYYFDSIGGTKWDGTSASSSGGGVYKAGIESSVSCVFTQASGGAMEGHYHVTSSKYNTRTGEESTFSELQYNTAEHLLETRASEGDGGLILTNWASVRTNTEDAKFEYDAIRLWRTLGNTEWMGFADAGAGVEMFSYVLYEESIIFASQAALSPPSFFLADEMIVRNRQPTNRGGVPPGALHGCFNGSQAIYLHVYPKSKDNILYADSKSVFPEMMMYSIAGFPASVPQIREYHIGGAAVLDLKYFDPHPWTGVVPNGVSGKVTGCGYLGSTFFIFTATQTYVARPSGDGQMRPILMDQAHGALGVQAIVQTPRSVHALGKESWLRISAQGYTDIARFQFTTTLDEITDPTGGAAMPTVGGYYSHRDEVWFAVAKTGGTAAQAQRILIYDDAKRQLVSVFDPANLSTAGIVAMVELCTPAQTPIMLVALDTGVILSYPGSQYTDAVTGGDNLPYACHWQGLYGQENRAYDQKLARLDVHMQENVTDGITLGVSGHRSAARVDTDAEVAKLIPKSKENFVDRTVVDFGNAIDGNVYEVKFSTTTAQGAQWKVGDMIIDIDRI